MTLWPIDYIRPGLAADHCADVLGGSYDVPLEMDPPPVILDLGANIGAFARWAAQRWPGSTIHCYEPQPDNYALLCRTLANITEAKCIPYRKAVFDQSTKAPLAQNGLNCGEYSLANTEGKPCDVVDVIPATELPLADILKLDVEGSEGVILEMLAAADRLKQFSAVMLELHSAKFLPAIPELLEQHGLRAIERRMIDTHRMELKFVR
jgi:FkbM family methyltransferase